MIPLPKINHFQADGPDLSAWRPSITRISVSDIGADGKRLVIRVDGDIAHAFDLDAAAAAHLAARLTGQDTTPTTQAEEAA